MTAYYHNEMLFSEIYLEEITRQPEHADVLASLKVLREYRDYANASSLEAWTQSYIHEVLAALGFNATVKNAGLTLLYPMGAVNQPVSLCFVTLPGESLDNTLLGRNWAEKTIRALREEGLRWGLLTNGKLWRIYHVDESTPYETYLEIDLERILIDQAKEAYQIFHKFMKAGNFSIGEDGKCQFDRFKKESKDKIDYIEKELANALKQIEERGKGVLSGLCMGYVEEIRASGDSNLDDETMRRKIYHSAMLYMFRLLFLFYADARGLLSDANSYLLSKVEAEARSLHNGAKDTEGPYSLWDQLSSIFVDIDQTYNGGLFSPRESEFTQFIEETRCANRYLAGTLFNLTTYREKNNQEYPISYRDMSVRNLGTLYEGLLEHKLFITKENTEVRMTKGKIEFIPGSRGGKLLSGHYLPTGAVYFGNDPSERKSTGSYYTPEYIVDYIVRNTVGEKLKELQADFLAREKDNLDGLGVAIDESERVALANLLEESALSFVRQKILSLSVLDPAMGSGHFLVNATNLIANFITEFLNDLKIQGETPTGTGYWRRWVVENCIYGVDLNPLAVELAKLSIWILSMAKDQPLSFMNHHLKCGNSLVGARLDEIGNYPFSTAKKEPHQFKMFERDPNFRAAVEDAIAKARLIAARGSTTLDDVEEKKTWLAEIEQELKGYKAICNLHTGLYFGHQVGEEQYITLVEKRDFVRAFKLENFNQYFHWELEFPEIFFGPHGFACVVSNPPYDTFKENEYFSRTPSAAAKTGNLYSHFIVKAVSINSSHGSIGFVVPLSFACGTSFEHVRQEIFTKYESLYASHYSKRPNMLFDGVQQRITIFYARNKTFVTKTKLYSSKLWRWKKADQEFVVRNPALTFVGTTSRGIIPKIHTLIGAEIYNYLSNAPQKLSSIFEDSHPKYPAYYHSVSMYWIKAYNFITHFLRAKDAKPSISSKLKTVQLRSEIDRNIFLLLMNSSLFYYWWISVSDEFDVQLSEIRTFGLYGYEILKSKDEEVQNLVNLLMNDYIHNSVIRTTMLGGSKSEYQEFYPRKSIKIINQIDDFIAPIYGLTQEQNDFLKTFDLVWRTDEE